MARSLFSRIRRFAQDRSGNVIIIFGLSIFPLTGLAGAAIDYSRANAERMKLDNAADAAALAAVTKSVQNNLAPPDPTQVEDYFKAVAQTSADVTLTDVTVKPSTSVTSVFVTVSYKATIKTSFLTVFGFNTLDLGGASTSAADKPKFVNFYLLLDNSPSMGLAATDADIEKLQSLTPDSCAFACHQHTFDSKGRITGDSKTDYYTVAKKNNVTTRIDVLRSATKNLAQTADKSQQMANQFKMAIYTFSDIVQTISAVSPNLISGSPNVQSLADNIDLAYAYKDQRDTQTSFDTAMNHMNTFIPDPGNGASGTQPAEFLFIVTDGVQDQPVKSKSGSGDKPDPIASGSTYIPPAVTTSPNLYSSRSGNVSSTRQIGVFDDSLCTTVKNRGIRIAVLYTPYLPVTNNAFYNAWVAPISSNIPLKLQACASPGFYFQITPTQGINEAMQAMFQAALSAARLTQ